MNKTKKEEGEQAGSLSRSAVILLSREKGREASPRITVITPRTVPLLRPASIALARRVASLRARMAWSCPGLPLFPGGAAFQILRTVASAGIPRAARQGEIEGFEALYSAPVRSPSRAITGSPRCSAPRVVRRHAHGYSLGSYYNKTRDVPAVWSLIFFGCRAIERDRLIRGNILSAGRVAAAVWIVGWRD